LLVSNEALAMEIKKEWKTPVILVLVRGTSEENVLRVCKDKPRTQDCEPESGGGFIVQEITSS
jgi:hypothetical protein